VFTNEKLINVSHCNIHLYHNVKRISVNHNFYFMPGFWLKWLLQPNIEMLFWLTMF